VRAAGLHEPRALVPTLRGARAVRVTPLTLREARAFVASHHRHAPAPQGGLFAIGAANDDEVVGVVIVGHPVSRHMADGWTAEVTRLCTDGSRNACSLLYAAAWRAARAMGYRRLITYTLATEPGTSLRAAGWRVVAEVKRESWHRRGRPRVDLHPLQERLRWEVSA
jgi:hypothetical protein